MVISPIKASDSILVAIKSDSIDSLITAYHFTQAALENCSVELSMIFFYQDAAYSLLNSEINQQWQNLIIKHKLNAVVCKGSCKKRGIIINQPFKASSLLEFIKVCETTDRIIQF